MASDRTGGGRSMGRPALLAMAAAGVMLVLSLAPVVGADRTVRVDGRGPTECDAVRPAVECGSPLPTESSTPTEAPTEPGCQNEQGPTACATEEGTPTEAATPTEGATGSAAPTEPATEPVTTPGCQNEQGPTACATESETGSAEAQGGSPNVTPPSTTTTDFGGGASGPLLLALALLGLGTAGTIVLGLRPRMRRR